MNQLNSLIIEGALTENSKVKEVLGKPVTTFSIGVSRSFKNASGEEETETFCFDVEGAFIPEEIQKKLVKNRVVTIVGRLSQTTWTDKGKQRSKVYVVAEHITAKRLIKNRG